MPDNPLHPVTRENTTKDLDFALQHDGRRKVHNADSFIVRLVAERSVKHLEMSGFVLMKKPPEPRNTAGD